MKVAIADNGLIEDVTNCVKSGKDSSVMILPVSMTDESVESINFGNTELAMSSELGHFFGIFLGNGWVDKNFTKIHLASVNNELKTLFIERVNNLFRQTEAKGYKSPNTEHFFDGHLSVHGKASIDIPQAIRKSFSDYFGHGALNKKIPEIFFNAKKDFLFGLLSGLLDTDGSISCRDIVKKGKLQQNKNVTYSTSSYKLALGVQKVCLSLGINASITIFVRKTDEFSVVMSSIDIYALKDKLVLTTKKKDTLDSFVFGEQPNPKDIVPFSIEAFNLLRGSGQIGQDTFPYNAIKKGYITRDTLTSKYSKDVYALLDNQYNITDRRFSIVCTTKEIDQELSDTLRFYLLKESKGFVHKKEKGDKNDQYN